MPGTSLHVTSTVPSTALLNSSSSRLSSTTPSTALPNSSSRTESRSRGRPVQRAEIATSRRRGRTSPEVEDDLERPWRSDENVTAAQLASIKAEISHYEKTRAYNIIRNRRLLQELRLPEMAKDVASGNLGSFQTLEATRSTGNQSSGASPPSRSRSLGEPFGQDSGAPVPSRSRSSERRLSSADSSPRAPSSRGLFPSPTAPQRSPTRSQVPRTVDDNSFGEIYPTSSRWPRWMKGIIPIMQSTGPKCVASSDAMEAWVEFEDLMAYPDSKVR